MRRSPLFLSLLAATAIGGAAIAQQAVVETPKLRESTPGHPSYGTWGFDKTGMNASVAPGDNFYDYANGTWYANAQIPADKTSTGPWDVLQELSRDRTRTILEAAQKNPSSKIGNAYATYLDTAAIEVKGLTPIKPWLDRIKGLNDKAGYPALVAEADRNGVGVPFSSGVGQDSKIPDQYSQSLDQAGLGLPTREYYLEAQFAEKKAAYQEHLAKVLTLAGEPDAAARAAAIVAFETEIAKVHWDRAKTRDADLTYNKMTVADLQKAAPGFDFAAYFKGVGTPVDTVIVGEPSAITGEAALIAATPLPVLKDQLMVRSIDGFASVLPKAFDDERFHMFGTVLSGVPQQQPRWKRAVDYTSGVLTDDVAQPYVAAYFPPATKAKMDELVRNLISAMHDRIGKLDWMQPATRAKAQAKLAAFTPRIGYPDKWHDYSALTITRGDAFGNSLRANQWRHDWNVQKLGKPIFRWEWGMAPMTVNASASFSLLAITFPAAILQPPFFDPNADDAVNYGAIGAVIGHEMSHQFDDQGAKYDATGRLTQWWTDADVAAFKARTAKLSAQVSKYEILPGVFVKGDRTLGEDTADIAGLMCALDAYHASLKGKPAPVIDGLTGDQRFFLGFAQAWRQKRRPEVMRSLVVADVHSPDTTRPSTVRNLDAWYAAFKPQPGQKLYLAPADRVRIW